MVNNLQVTHADDFTLPSQYVYMLSVVVVSWMVVLIRWPW